MGLDPALIGVASHFMGWGRKREGSLELGPSASGLSVAVQWRSSKRAGEDIPKVDP